MKVKILRGTLGKISKLEDEVNAWLEKGHEVDQIIQTQSYGDRVTHVVITIYYHDEGTVD